MLVTVEKQPRDARGRFVRPLQGAKNVGVKADGSLYAINLEHLVAPVDTPLPTPKATHKVKVKQPGRYRVYALFVLACGLAAYLGMSLALMQQ